MRYLVELLDKDPLENIVGTCVFEPEIVIFLCDKKDTHFFKEAAIYRFFKRRKIKTKPRFYYIDTDYPSQIRTALQAIVKDYPGCYFDLSGGKDLVLVEASAYCIPNNIPAYYINLRKHRFLNIQNCEDLSSFFSMPNLSAEDLFVLQGATASNSGHYTDNGPEQNLEKDIFPVWDIVSQNIKAWSSFVSFLQGACNFPITQLEVPLAKNSLKKKGFRLAILQKLEHSGIIKLVRNKGEDTIIFKSLEHKKSLLNQGIWLELYCYKSAKNTGFFNDVRTSMLIDWDASRQNYESTKNEIDVFLMYGVVPVFISCKMSLPSPLALSEIRLLSGKFGGKSSRTILITGATIKNENWAIKQRANDLNVKLIDFNDICSGKIAELLKKAAMGL